MRFSIPDRRAASRIMAGIACLSALGCSSLRPPKYDLLSSPGRHHFGDVVLEVSGREIVVDDPNCGRFVGTDRRRLISPFWSYRFKLERVDRLTPACEAANAATHLDVIVNNLDQSTLTAEPYGDHLGYQLWKEPYTMLTWQETYRRDVPNVR